MLAEFKYGGQPKETFGNVPIIGNQAKPNRFFYHLKKDLFPAAYWNLMVCNNYTQTNRRLIKQRRSSRATGLGPADLFALNTQHHLISWTIHYVSSYQDLEYIASRVNLRVVFKSHKNAPTLCMHGL